MDREFGGVFTLLRDDGTRQSDDKVMWSQGRVLWVYSVLYNELGRDPNGWSSRIKPPISF